MACLAQAPLFRGLSPRDCEDIASRAKGRRLSRGQVLFREGECAAEVSVLSAGRLKLVQVSSDGQEIIQRLVGPGELCGGVGLTPGGPYQHTAVALETSNALCWDREGFEASLDRWPILQRNALRILAERLRAAEERCRELATAKVPQRVAHVLLRLVGQAGRPEDGGVLVALSREEVAQMAGTTLFTVSRLFSQWEALGLVRPRREAVVVDDTRGLLEIAEGQSPLTAPGRPRFAAVS